MKKLLPLLFSVLFFLTDAKGQGGEIYGTLIDSKTNLLSGVSIKVYNGDRFYGRSLSEGDGMFSIKPLPPGSYTVEFSLNSFLKRKTIGVIVNSGSSVKLNYIMIEGSSDSEIVINYKLPPRPYREDDHSIFRHLFATEYLSKNVEMSRTQIPIIKPEIIFLTWSEQIKYQDFPRIQYQKQINKKYTEQDFQYIPFEHFLQTLPILQR